MFGIAPIVEEEEGWGKIGIVMVSLAVIFAGGVAYFIATSSDEELTAAAAQEGEVAALATTTDASATLDAAPMILDAAAEPSAADETRAALLAGATQDGGMAAQEPDAASNAAGPLRANGEVDRPAGLISLSIESEPPGANVIRKRDGVRLGTTPYLYETESQPGNASFILQLDGYKSMSLSLPSDQDSVRQVMLLPGKGGAPIPALTPETEIDSPPVKTPAKKPSVEAKPSAASPAKPKQKPARRVKAAPREQEPKRPAKRKGGRVDYTADPIPLD